MKKTVAISLISFGLSLSIKLIFFSNPLVANIFASNHQNNYTTPLLLFSNAKSHHLTQKGHAPFNPSLLKSQGKITQISTQLGTPKSLADNAQNDFVLYTNKTIQWNTFRYNSLKDNNKQKEVAQIIQESIQTEDLIVPKSPLIDISKTSITARDKKVSMVFLDGHVRYAVKNNSLLLIDINKFLKGSFLYPAPTSASLPIDAKFYVDDYTIYIKDANKDLTIYRYEPYHPTKKMHPFAGIEIVIDEKPPKMTIDMVGTHQKVNAPSKSSKEQQVVKTGSKINLLIHNWDDSSLLDQLTITLSKQNAKNDFRKNSKKQIFKKTKISSPQTFVGIDIDFTDYMARDGDFFSIDGTSTDELNNQTELSILFKIDLEPPSISTFQKVGDETNFEIEKVLQISSKNFQLKLNGKNNQFLIFQKNDPSATIYVSLQKVWTEERDGLPPKVNFEKIDDNEAISITTPGFIYYYGEDIFGNRSSVSLIHVLD